MIVGSDSSPFASPSVSTTPKGSALTPRHPEKQQDQYIIAAKIMFVVLVTFGAIVGAAFTGIAGASLIASGGLMNLFGGVMVLSAACGLVVTGVTAPLWGIAAVQHQSQDSSLSCFQTLAYSLGTGAYIFAWPITLPVTCIASCCLCAYNEDD